jgi:hypothetical protein
MAAEMLAKTPAEVDAMNPKERQQYESSLVNTTKLISASIAAAAGLDPHAAALASANAVENNHLRMSDLQKKFEACGNDTQCLGKNTNELIAKSSENRNKALDQCQDKNECYSAITSVTNDRNELQAYRASLVRSLIKEDDPVKTEALNQQLKNTDKNIASANDVLLELNLIKGDPYVNLVSNANKQAIGEALVLGDEGGALGVQAIRGVNNTIRQRSSTNNTADNTTVKAGGNEGGASGGGSGGNKPPMTSDQSSPQPSTPDFSQKPTQGTGYKEPTMTDRSGNTIPAAVPTGTSPLNQTTLNTSGGTANTATGAKLVDDLAANMSKPTVTDAALANVINQQYRPGATVGIGSTADAVRHELATGELVGGRSHTQKAQNDSAFLQKWLDSNPDASFSDRSAAHNVLRDLQNALGGK